MNQNGLLEKELNNTSKKSDNNEGAIQNQDETSNINIQVPQTTRLIQTNPLLNENKGEDNDDKEEDNILIKVRSYDNINMTSKLKMKFENFMKVNNNNESNEKNKGEQSPYIANNKQDKQNNKNHRSNSNSKVIHTTMKLKNKPSFLNRMTADLHKRRTKEERLNLLIERNKIKHTEKERINGFNRLIDDANRRIEAKSKMENLKTHITEENQIIAEFKKSYNHGKWNEIYKERFEKYQLQSKEKIFTKQKEITKKKEEDEERVVELIKETSKKIPKEQIDQICLRLYEDQRKVFVKEIKESQQEVNNKDITSLENNQTHKSTLKEIGSSTPNKKESKKVSEKDKEEDGNENQYNPNARNKTNNNPNNYSSNTVYKNIPFRIKTEYDHYTPSSKKKTTKPRTKKSVGIVKSPTNIGNNDIEYIERNLINSLTQSNVLQTQSKASSQIYTSEIKQRKINNSNNHHLSKSPFESKLIIRDIDAVKLVSNVLKKNFNS